MPSSHHRPSQATVRRPHAQAHASQRQPLSQPSPSSTAQSATELLREELKNAYTEVNKVASERDRYLHRLDEANKKLSDVHAAKEELKNQLHDFKDKYKALQDDNSAYKHKSLELSRETAELRDTNNLWARAYEALEHENEVLRARATGAAVKLPERPKSTPKSTHKPSGKHSHSRDKETKHHKADRDKERLSRRFSSSEKRPPTRIRHASFVDPRSPGAAPAEDYADFPAPALHKVAFSQVPRTTNLLGASLYQSSGAVLYDERFEDGNYHAYPVER